MERWALTLLRRITNALPEGRIKDLFRQPLRPSHPSWMDAQYTITMADSRVTHWEQHLAPYRDRVRRVLEIGCYEGQSVRMLTSPAWIHGRRKGWARSDARVSSSGASMPTWSRHLGKRVRKLKMTSNDSWLTLRNETFDLIYIDAIIVVSSRCGTPRISGRACVSVA